MSGFAPDPSRTTGMREVSDGQYVNSPEAGEAIDAAIAEVGTPSAVQNDPDIEQAKRMVTRLHVDARDIRNGTSVFSNDGLERLLDEAADVISILIGRLR